MPDALAQAKPVSELPAGACRKIVAIASDIDDTITTDGKIPPEAFAALWQAREAGLKVIPVTGRPAGWCDHIARMWPVDGVVGENGALWFRHVAGDPGRVKRHYVFEAAERAANRKKLEAVRNAILAAVPGCAVASDQAWREFDLAIDFCEDVPRLPESAVTEIVRLFESHGCTAKVSSIHVNGWFGRYDKLSMVRSFLKDELGVDADAARETVLFTGDSPNDEPMFSHFPVSVGMANIRDFASRIVHPPAYVASKRGGGGFAETVGILLANR
jgi:HAD superfamily hydrolase (TIGR01484 family)